MPWRPNLRGKVKYDDLPPLTSFGEVVEDAAAGRTFVAGSGDVAAATFWGANPRADLKHGGTFTKVKRLGEDGDWALAYADGDFCTKFSYRRVGKVVHRHEAHVAVEWAVPADAVPGTYKLEYYGDATSRFTGKTTPFKGSSGTFEVVAPAAVR